MNSTFLALYRVGVFAVSEDPIVVLGRMLLGVAELVFPIGFGGGDLILLEQRTALLVVVGAGGEVRSEFAGHGRGEVHLLLGVEEGGELVELLLGNGVELVIVALRA